MNNALEAEVQSAFLSRLMARRMVPANVKIRQNTPLNTNLSNKSYLLEIFFSFARCLSDGKLAHSLGWQKG